MASLRQTREQLRKRKDGIFKKTNTLMRMRGELRSAVIIYNTTTGQYYVYLSTDDESWLPPTLESIRRADPPPQILHPADFDTVKAERPKRSLRPTPSRPPRASQGRAGVAVEWMRQFPNFPEPPTFDLECGSAVVDNTGS